MLHGADLGVIDPVTRQYTTWVWSYSRAPLEAGEAIALCLATGASYADTIRTGSIAAEGREKEQEDGATAHGSTARHGGRGPGLWHGGPAIAANRPAPVRCLGSGDRTASMTLAGTEVAWARLAGRPSRTLGQAVAGCLPDGDEDRRIIMGLLGSNVMAMALPDNGRPRRRQTAGARLPGFETEEDDGTA